MNQILSAKIQRIFFGFFIIIYYPAYGEIAKNNVFKPIIKSTVKPFDPKLIPPLVILFETNKYRISNFYQERLKRYAAKINKTMRYKVIIKGYADIRGNNKYNYKLSKNRAFAIQKSLKKAGIDIQKTETIAYGEMRPSDIFVEEYEHYVLEDRLQKQRRVTIQIVLCKDSKDTSALTLFELQNLINAKKTKTDEICEPYY